LATPIGRTAPRLPRKRHIEHRRCPPRPLHLLPRPHPPILPHPLEYRDIPPPSITRTTQTIPIHPRPQNRTPPLRLPPSRLLRMPHPRIAPAPLQPLVPTLTPVPRRFLREIGDPVDREGWSQVVVQRRRTV
ncbi:hypothetical protein C0991_000928, partial [Blastosporella zonata]